MRVGTNVRARAKWSERAPRPPETSVNERGLALLAHLATHRFLTAEQLAKLDGGSVQNVKRFYLRELFDLGMVDRVGDGFGLKAYAISGRGARFLRAHGHRIPDGVRWSWNNKRAGARYIDHSIAVADLLIDIRRACQARSDIKFLFEDEVLAFAPDKTRQAREPLRWRMPNLKSTWGVSSVVADGLFGLDFSDGTSSYFLLERDRGGMAINRRKGFDEQSSIARKIVFYYEGWKARKHVEQFGVLQMRVLVVTTTPGRVENMVEAVKKLTGGSGSNFFLFCDQSNLANKDPLQVVWTTGKGQSKAMTT